MRDYVCCLTFNNLAKKNTSPGVGSCLENREKKKYKKAEGGGGGGGSRDGCLFPSNIFYSAFIFRYDDLFLA